MAYDKSAAKFQSFFFGKFTQISGEGCSKVQIIFATWCKHRLLNLTTSSVVFPFSIVKFRALNRLVVIVWNNRTISFLQKRFKDQFPDGIMIKKGGMESGLQKAETNAHEAKLFKVAGGMRPVMTEVTTVIPNEQLFVFIY